jgi:MFS family permease
MTRAPDSPSQQKISSPPSRKSGSTSGGYPSGCAPSTNGSHSAAESHGPNQAIETFPVVSNAGTKSEPVVIPEPNVESASTSESESDSQSGSELAITAEDRTSFWQVLRNRNFVFLWAGQVFSQLADKVYLVLMIALISSQFQESGQSMSGWVSSLMVAFTIPAVVFGSVAGVLVDRWSKKWTMILTNVLRGGLVLVLPTLLWATQDQGNILQVPIGFWAMLGVTFWVSTLTQFFAPAEQSAIPLMVERKQLLSANSFYTFTMMLAVIVGFAAGDPLLSLAHHVLGKIPELAPFSGELVVGGSYAIAGILLLALKTGETSHPQVTDLHQVWSDIRDGLRFIRAHRRIRGALIQLVVLFSIFAALAVLVVRMAQILPEIKSSQFGFLLAAGGVGMVAGIAILNRIVHHVSYRKLSLYGSIGMGGALFGLAFTTHHLWLSLSLLALIGICAALVGVPMQTTIQEQTPEDMRGKVFGLQNNMVNIALSLPLALAGIAETVFHLEPVLIALAALVVTGGGVTWYISGTAPVQETALDPSGKPPVRPLKN